MRKALIKLMATLSAACPNGGNCQAGTSGPWANRCIKCGNPV